MIWNPWITWRFQATSIVVNFLYEAKAKENIRCRGNSEDTRRLSYALSQATRPLGRTAAALAVE